MTEYHEWKKQQDSFIKFCPSGNRGMTSHGSLLGKKFTALLELDGRVPRMPAIITAIGIACDCVSCTILRITVGECAFVVRSAAIVFA